MEKLGLPCRDSRWAGMALAAPAAFLRISPDMHKHSVKARGRIKGAESRQAREDARCSRRLDHRPAPTHSSLIMALSDSRCALTLAWLINLEYLILRG